MTFDPNSHKNQWNIFEEYYWTTCYSKLNWSSKKVGLVTVSLFFTFKTYDFLISLALYPTTLNRNFRIRRCIKRAAKSILFRMFTWFYQPNLRCEIIEKIPDIPFVDERFADTNFIKYFSVKQFSTKRTLYSNNINNFIKKTILFNSSLPLFLFT